MPKLLFIDTSAAIATVALSVNERVVSIRRHENAQEQAAKINYLIKEVLDESSISFEGLDGVCVCAGPGSYTGLRVGLSTAKGIAYAHDLPLLLFNKLDLLAAQQKVTADFLIALKARTAEYFMAVYDAGGNQTKEPQHAFADDLISIAGENTFFYTDDIDFTVSNKVVFLEDSNTLDVAVWLEKALQRFDKKDFDDLAYSEPFYLKAAYTTQSKK